MADADELTPTHLLFTLIGVASHLVVGVLVAASGLVAPFWGVMVLMVVWLAAAVVTVMKWRERMFIPLLMAIGTAVFWIAFVSFGDAVLGWTA
jgi:hypothetical protein